MKYEIETVTEFFDRYFEEYKEHSADKTLQNDFFDAVKKNTTVILRGIQDAVNSLKMDNLDIHWIIIPDRWYKWICNYLNDDFSRSARCLYGIDNKKALGIMLREWIDLDPKTKPLIIFGFNTYIVSDDGPKPMVISEFGRYVEIEI